MASGIPQPDLLASGTSLAMSNGHTTSMVDADITTITQPPPTEGFVLHDDKAIITGNDATESVDRSVNMDLGKQETSSDEEDAEGSEDAEYDVEYIQNTRSLQPARDSSEESSRSMKRKVADDDDLIQQNPELYGLRRSGRAKQNTTVVESSDNDSDVIRNVARKRRRTSSGRVSNQPTPSSPSDASDSESDVYVGARRNALTKKQKRHQHQVANGLAPPSHGEVRFSNRKAAKITSYNEGDDDDEDLEMSDGPGWYYEAEDHTAAIDLVLDHKLKDGKNLEDPEISKNDFQYLIKWQEKAHYHATWETTESLSQFKGLKRLDNYFAKRVEAFIAMSVDKDIPMEDKEQFFMAREGLLEAQQEHQEVERIIDMREGEEETEYEVKWKGVEYKDCTWEPASLVSNLAQNEIDLYLDRSSKLPVSDKSQTNLATRRPYQPFKVQPSYIKHGQLREFQIHGINFLAHHWCKGNNVILADEMGLGKTVQTVAFLNWLRHDRKQQGPFLVVVPLTTIPAWGDTLKNWTPDINYVVYLGKAPSRSVIRDKEITMDGNPRKVKAHVVITSYEFILSDESSLSAIPWQFLVVDEAHRLKNRDSQLYNKLMGFKIPSRLLITGTPLQNTLGELSALMDFLMPGKIEIDENIDLASTDASEKLNELTEAIKPYMIRRTKQKVENDLPPKTEKIIRVELSDVQLDYYKNILTRNYSALNAGAKGPKQSLLNIMMELKKASNHPFMFPSAEQRIVGENPSREELLKGLVTSSGKMFLLDRLLTKLKADGHRVLIFSQMVRMLDLLGDYLQLRGYKFQRLDGTIASGPRRIAIDHFNAEDSEDFCFILSTRAGGLGINLMTADTVILFDSDWNPQADLQAMARAHRIGQKNPVSIYRFVSKDTVEEEILERARNKLMLEFITIQRGVTDQDGKLFDKEFSQRVARATKTLSEPSSADDISRILKRRGQKMFEQSGNQKKLEDLDIDAVLADAEEHKTEQPEGITTDGGEDFLRSFEYTDVKIDVEWDDIIPKEQLEVIKAEEKRKEEEAATALLIEQSQPRKRKNAAVEEREQRAAKKRARLAAAEYLEDASSDSAPEDDPRKPLDEKEIRNLINAYQRYGALEDKPELVMKAARMPNRDRAILQETLNVIIDKSKELLREEQDKIEQLEKEQNKSISKKDRKAVLFEYRGYKRLNADTIIERPEEMRMIRNIVDAAPDWKNFRIPEATKPASYTCDWGAREDGMLCVGIARHGFGAWVEIRDDAELGLGDKFYLEEHRVERKEERKNADTKNLKSPGAVHLVRRANYLLSVLKHKLSNGTNVAAKRALENHHRNSKKWTQSNGRSGTSPRTTGSPAPTPKIKVQREMEKARDRAASTTFHHRYSDSRHSDHRYSDHKRSDSRPLSSHHRQSSEQRPNQDRRDQNGTLDIRRHNNSERDSNGHRIRTDDRHSSHQRNGSNGTSSKSHQVVDEQVAALFAPKRATLKRLYDAASSKNDQPGKLDRIKAELGSIDDFVEEMCQGDKSALDLRLWNFVAKQYWPKLDVPGKTLQAMAIKLRPKPGSGPAAKPNEGAMKPVTTHASSAQPTTRV